MRSILNFLSNMEGRPWRTVLATVLLLGGMIALFTFGKVHLDLGGEHRLEAWLAGFQRGPWGLVAAVVVFTVAAFFGAPQFLLIAACVVAFGPWFGFLYSWIATIASAGVTYWLGRGPAAHLVARHGGATVARLTRFVGRNAFHASFMIRNVPSAPFIVVNMAFGASRASFVAFLSGCALGVLPKTALVAFFGGSFMTAVKGDGVWTSAILAGVALGWLGLMLVVRGLVRRAENASNHREPTL